jgi:L-ascorbate metabolism protein UlaG (beta-lactamase superfamily)
LLRPDVLIEPLFNQWYTWPYLLSPATSAMYVAGVHLKLMQSFVEAPQMHVTALKNPVMRGGPFVDHDPSRVGEVRELLERTVKHESGKVAFAEAVKTLDRLLADEATGQTLEPLYKRIPDPLRGYVELVYDLNHHPSVRFLEGLLYRSPYHDTSCQSIAFSHAGDENRRFVFSTPRLPRAGDVCLDIPFSSPALDALYRARYAPRLLGELVEELGVPASGAERFAALFTDRAPRPAERYAGEGVRVRYFGHACVLIETKEVSILSDPLISHDYECGVTRYTHADLPPVIDYVLITHSHQDHAVLEPLLELRHRVRTVVVPRGGRGSLVDPSLKLILKHAGLKQVVDVGELEEIAVPGGTIVPLPFLGEHGDLDIATKLAYSVHLGGRSVMLVADSNNVDPAVYEHIHALTGDIDVLFIGMECEGAPMSWLYGPLFTRPLTRKMDQSRRLDGSDFVKAADIVRRLNPGQVYVYAMGQEPWLNYLTSLHYTPTSRQIVESDKLVEDCRSRGIPSERLYCQKEIVLAAKSSPGA